MRAVTIWATVPILMEACRTSTPSAACSTAAAMSGCCESGVSRFCKTDTLAPPLCICPIVPLNIVVVRQRSIHTALSLVRRETDLSDAGLPARLFRSRCVQLPRCIRHPIVKSICRRNVRWLHAKNAEMNTTNALSLSFKGSVISLTASSARFRRWRRLAATVYAGSSVTASKWVSTCSVAPTVPIQPVS